MCENHGGKPPHMAESSSDVSACNEVIANVHKQIIINVREPSANPGSWKKNPLKYYYLSCDHLKENMTFISRWCLNWQVEAEKYLHLSLSTSHNRHHSLGSCNKRGLEKLKCKTPRADGNNAHLTDTVIYWIYLFTVLNKQGSLMYLG